MGKDQILYFGYGLNRSPSFLEALLGRVPKLYSTSVLHDYDLVIQSLRELPENAQKIISRSYGNDFVSYGLCKSSGRSVSGITWIITKDELEILKTWELTGIWQELVEVVVTGNNGKKHKAKTHIIPVRSGISVPDTMNYNNFVVDARRIINSARRDAKFTRSLLTSRQHLA